MKNETYVVKIVAADDVNTDGISRSIESLLTERYATANLCFEVYDESAIQPCPDMYKRLYEAEKPRASMSCAGLE